MYLRLYPLQAVIGFFFGFNQPQANKWVMRLLPLLQEALRRHQALPERDPARWAGLFQKCQEQLVRLDATQRPIRRPKDPVKQEQCYNGYYKWGRRDENAIKLAILKCGVLPVESSSPFTTKISCSLLFLTLLRGGIFFPWAGQHPGFYGEGFHSMKSKAKRGKCLHCQKLFVPDYRNRGRQKYCSTPECQKAGKHIRQQQWLSKPENRDVFRGSANVERVRTWRQAHPDYWKRSRRHTARTLQDACAEQPAAPQAVPVAPLPDPCPGTLQDVCQAQVPLLVGLIAKFTDSTLQDDIETFARRLIAKGQDILAQPARRLTQGNLVYDDPQTTVAPRAPAASAAAL
jgi:hypothetical protein